MTAVPLTSPPRAVRLVVLELMREEYRDEELLNRALDGHDGDDTQNCVRDIPELKEPLKMILASQASIDKN